MNKIFFINLMICAFVSWSLAYMYLYKQNEIIAIKLQIPEVIKELQKLEDENANYEYELLSKQSPQKQIQWSSQWEFMHLKHPEVSDIVTIRKKQEK